MIALQIAIDVLMDLTIVHTSATGDSRASHSVELCGDPVLSHISSAKRCCVTVQADSEELRVDPEIRLRRRHRANVPQGVRPSPSPLHLRARTRAEGR